MSNFEFALLGVGVAGLVIFAYVMTISHWHERKRRHVH